MRSSGVLMHISSLPSAYGIGTMGKEAMKFIDFLKGAGQSYWQMLPVCPTSYGDSPYQSFSTYAGNPYFIDLELLCEKGLLTREECEALPWGDSRESVDYGVIYENRYPLLHNAFERFKRQVPDDFETFCGEQREWLEDYAIFMALKDANGGRSWSTWEDSVKKRNPQAMDRVRAEHREAIYFWKMIQYLFFEQWNALKEYANESGISIIGDVPIYVAADSVDVWANPGQFYLDENLDLIDVAGCPPDAFSEDGQLWGNPLYRWDEMKKDEYAWWTRRIAFMSRLYDVVRIDHFRGFDSYYAIPFGEPTARRGEWRTGPGVELFHTVEKKLGNLNIIAEDLGFLTPSVKQMLESSGFPGMKLLQFAFDSREDGDYQPHNYDRNCVVYTGTHDNDTILGWMKTAPKESAEFAKKYLRLRKKEGYHWGMMKAAWASVGDLAIVTMQDLLGLSSEARMNTPSILGGNWQWRMQRDALTDKLAKKIYTYTNMYGRTRK